MTDESMRERELEAANDAEVAEPGHGPVRLIPHSSPIAVVVLTALASAAILIPTMLLLTRDEGSDPADVSSFLAGETADVEQRSWEVFDLLTNYDSTTFGDVSDRILALSTGNFREQYEEIVGTGLNEALAEAEASSEGEILHGPEITFRSANEAVALAGIEQTTRSETAAEGRTITYLMRLTLVRDGAEWKADRIEILSGEVAEQPGE
jgi:hypothetical protein